MEFSNRRRMRFWAYLGLVKLDKAKGTLAKAYKRQFFFLETVIIDYSPSILFLDYINNEANIT